MRLQPFIPAIGQVKAQSAFHPDTFSAAPLHRPEKIRTVILVNEIRRAEQCRSILNGSLILQNGRKRNRKHHFVLIQKIRKQNDIFFCDLHMLPPQTPQPAWV